jgi:Response regulator containing CheY-like receiver, AAA-type ATPase, and DNA-binding domains
MISLLISSILKRQDWQVITARDVETTVAMACASPSADVMLLDMHFPDGTAEDVLRRLSALTHLATVPVVLMTGARREELNGVLESAAVAAVLSKPVDGNALVGAIRRVLDSDADQQE